jgi:septal ring factor EnvC (AmiA/AmiB activator)
LSACTRSSYPGSRLLVCGLLVAAFAFAARPVVVARADPGSVASKQAQARQVLAAVHQLDLQLNRAAEAYDAANWKLAVTKRALRENGRELVFARRNRRRAQARLGQRLRAIYTSEAPSTLDVIVGAASLDDLMSRLDTVQRVSAEDAQIVREVTHFRAEVSKRRTRLAQARSEQVRVVANRAAQGALIAGQLARRRHLLASVQSEVARLQRLERARQLAVSCSREISCSSMGSGTPGSTSATTSSSTRRTRATLSRSLDHRLVRPNLGRGAEALVSARTEAGIQGAA